MGVVGERKLNERNKADLKGNIFPHVWLLFLPIG